MLFSYHGSFSALQNFFFPVTMSYNYAYKWNLDTFLWLPVHSHKQEKKLFNNRSKNYMCVALSLKHCNHTSAYRSKYQQTSLFFLFFFHSPFSLLNCSQHSYNGNCCFFLMRTSHLASIISEWTFFILTAVKKQTNKNVGYSII